MKRITWGKYAGFRKVGTELISNEGRETHLRRASWLTAMVESGGKFGCVINFDGTGITAGLHQAIAVYPRELRHPDKNPANDQGPLWKLLRLVRPVTKTAELWRRLDEIGWVIGRDNKVRFRETGEYVDGHTIREEFMGNAAGVVPVRGKGRMRATNWIEEFHDVFADSRTFNIQEEYGMEHFAKRADRAKFRFCKQKEWQRWQSRTMDDLFYKGTSAELTTFEEQPELDLALCMYWSHSVNAPGMALKVLCRALPKFTDAGLSDTWPRRLIKLLGNTKYGRWDDDIKNGRYQRTRRYAADSGFWPERFFEGPKAIMPRDLKG